MVRICSGTGEEFFLYFTVDRRLEGVSVCLCVCGGGGEGGGGQTENHSFFFWQENLEMRYLTYI